MKYYEDEFYYSITGDKSSIIRMLNAPMRNAGTSNVINENDDEESIN